jgi:hypothetical protein
MKDEMVDQKYNYTLLAASFAFLGALLGSLLFATHKPADRALADSVNLEPSTTSHVSEMQYAPSSVRPYDWSRCVNDDQCRDSTLRFYDDVSKPAYPIVFIQ